MEKILVVEDDDDIRNLIAFHLENEGFFVTRASNKTEALAAWATDKFSVVVLDWMLPGGESGIDLCSAWRKDASVLMITARTDSSDEIQALEAGSDDYIAKPFEVPVLLARVKSLLRRKRPSGDYEKSDFLQVGNLKLDLQLVSASCCGEELELTALEFNLLVLLIKNSGKVLSRRTLINALQGEGIKVSDRTIDTHIYAIRKKLLKCSEYIETIRGFGYKIAQPN